jgi:hypothetical protein
MGRARRVMWIVRGDLKAVRTQVRRCWFLKCSFDNASKTWNIGAALR